MPIFNPSEEALIVQGYLTEVEAQIAIAEADLGAQVNRMQRGGASIAAIETFLAANRETVLRAITNRAGRVLSGQLSQMSFASYWNKARKESNWWKWVWEPTAKHCRTCSYRNNRVGTTAQMEKIGVPRYGTTECSVGCRCDLQAITENAYLVGKASGKLITLGKGHPPGGYPRKSSSRRAVSR